MPDITIHQGREPDLEPADVRVVIDVIRAFTTTQVVLAGGADRILLAEKLEEARRLADASPSRLLAGERDAVAPPGFDFGNSPAELDEADLEGRTLVLTTTNGVRATVHAGHDGPLWVTGFANAGSTVSAIQRELDGGATSIQLVASHPDGDEDVACAEWVRARLRGLEEPTDGEVEGRIRNCCNADKFLDPEQPAYRAADIDYFARRADAPWVMEVNRRDGVVTIESSSVVEAEA